MIQLIPAIDLIDGKCVRLSKGDYDTKKIYNENPLEVALEFEAHGIQRLHLVDLDGAKAGRIINHKVLETIASKTGLVIDFGGGLKTSEDLRIAFESGASMVTGGSIAVKNPDEFTGWVQKYGSGKIILGSDVKDRKIAVSGWLETSNLELFPFLEDYMAKGITQTICTDISKDGMLEGPSLELYEEIQARFPSLFLIASGGVSSMDDIEKLHQAGVPAVIFGKAIYEGRISMAEIERFHTY
ncbi:1-(5-phosphoribosyl)-5-[(5-phosphoribosylamino)methylideneamino] imidazole-4-carboxamide isomerase [Breznakibacter xylanolyticus]|uniref:1-(5-phosphoribosyl)-5-[(5-phosphoribosylamino)methylideneamino] imidazole-4-carboxamide isomerase n=1 Tax=Breznakibacter xylanolyticus TaxID=990 RepID=A0A2W7NGT1_9BACT|nr:1-(5-phosphoribosyl)-5-[(5-phosphoribosylamino)methylideneamino]imidazole-4-carboxamide isomerase [Breznakibacter xylanolyticus]MBN2744770.1 1-(5-phosphoribosyl)-5-[(5-phosphoribosylamino)methylideneamino]imidazole-4-carboxamide isomerase [Marinilabiliaceae bacterium]PZX17407.1 1-(5-phosphoribosyl)-5-[(5-phosphoribosylamino)methylideneamino] imidazole-4-carboxamide isomerase [Breznakibacter xylanolyticus]